MHPKDKILLYLKQNIVYRWSYPEQSCSQSYISESSRCLEGTMKEHNTHVTSANYIHSESNNNPHANTFYFKVIDQESKQVAREDRKVIYFRINNLALNYYPGKIYI